VAQLAFHRRRLRFRVFGRHDLIAVLPSLAQENWMTWIRAYTQEDFFDTCSR